MSFNNAINTMTGSKRIDKEHEWKGVLDISTEKQFSICSGKTTKESAMINSEYDGVFVPDEVIQNH